MRDDAILQQDLVDGIRKYKIVVKSKDKKKGSAAIESDDFELVIESSSQVGPSLKYDKRRPLETVFI